MALGFSQAVLTTYQYSIHGPSIILLKISHLNEFFKMADAAKKTIIVPSKRVTFHENVYQDESIEDAANSYEALRQHGLSKASVNHESEVHENCSDTSPSQKGPPLISVPFVCLSDGLAQKATPFALSSWVALR